MRSHYGRPTRPPKREIDVDLSEVQPANAKADLAAAETLARQALKDNPRDTDYSSLLNQILAKEQAKPTK